MTHEAAATNARLIAHDRRHFIAAMGATIGAVSLGFPAFASTGSSARAQDWAWLTGNWDVWHRRLKDRLAGSDDWEEFSGKSAFWQTMNGLGNIDDNSLEIPSGSYRGLSVRAFDEKSRQWSIWWLDGRNPTYIEPPVRGAFEHGTGTFTGRDTFKGRPIIMRFRWNDIHSAKPWWEQAFSPDDGETWEVNWRNYFTRTAKTATALPALEGAPRDWDFLVGRWNVRHRRLRNRLVGSTQWDEFDGTFKNWAVLGGHANVGDNFMNLPGSPIYGIGLRAFDPAKREWLGWWLDGRNASVIGAPLRGSFSGGTGTFVGDETIDGRTVRTRVVWSRITPRSARWEQASSADGGTTWETNWTSDFERRS